MKYNANAGFQANKAILALAAAASMCALGGCASSGYKTNEEIRSQAAASRASMASGETGQMKSLAAEIAQALAPAANLSLPKPSLASEKRFDLNVKGLSADQVFQALTDKTPYNLIWQNGGKDTVTISLKDVTLREALEALREAYGYEFEFKDRNLVVSKGQIASKTYTVDYLLASRSGRSDVKVMSGSIEMPSATPGQQGTMAAGSGAITTGGQAGGRAQEASRVTTTISNDFWGALGASLNSIVSGEGRQVVINAQAGIIYVKGMPKEHREVEAYLKKVQGTVGRQVMLEAKILQVTLSDGSQSGINWSGFNKQGQHTFSLGANGSQINMKSGTDSSGNLIGARELLAGTVLNGTGGLFNASAGALGMAFTGNSFAALLNFLQTQGNVQVLSTPRVATLNNQKAVLKVGNDDFFVTNVSSTTTTSGSSAVSTPSISVQPFFSGIALDVTPQIDGSGEVTLHIHPSVSDVSEKVKNIDLGQMGNYKLPLASSSVNETDSIVKVKDGQIVALGGLMTVKQSGTVSKVPGLGDVPAAGELFKNKNESSSKTELVILIKPTVIQGQSDWNAGMDGIGLGK